MISTGRQSAGGAIVPTIRKDLRHPLPAQACLTRTSGVNLDNLPTGARCLVEKKHQELRPSCIVNGLRQHSGGKPFYVQILDCDQPILVDQLARFLVLEVPALVPDMNVRALEQPHCRAAPAAALLPPRNLPLAAPQSRFGAPVVPGILDLRAIGQHREAVQPDIDSGSAVTRRQRRGITLDAEAHEPAARFALDRNRLNLAFDGPVKFNLDVARALDAQFAVVEQPAAVAVRRECNTVITPRRTVALRFLAAAERR